MYPQTLCGWYNKIVRRYRYNNKTAAILDATFKPNPRLLSTIDGCHPLARGIKNRKAMMSAVNSLLKQHQKGVKASELNKKYVPVDETL